LTAPLRVLHLIYDDPANPWVAGGGAVRVFEIYRRLQDRVAVTVATGSFPGARDERIEGVQYRRLGSSHPYWWSRLTYGVAATRLLAEAEYDAAVFDFSTYVALRIPRNRPVGVTVHHVTGPRARERWGAPVGGAVEWLETRRLRNGQVFSATSTATEEVLRRIVGPRPQIRRVAAGVPDRLFSLPRAEGDFLLYFGRLDWEQKGLDTLVSSFRILAAQRPRLRLKIAGRGGDGERLRAAVRASGIEARVDILGGVEENRRDELFSGARLLLMPSRFEGFGMVAAEAMAAAIPVVGTDVDSLPEVVDPPRGGLLVPAGDPEALAEAADSLLSDDDRRRRIGLEARRSANRFRWSAVAEDHLEFLRSIRDTPPRIGKA
jgi:glycosyltransferase involved in cell wall biosynthesis